MQQTLRELEKINRYLGGNEVIMSGLNAIEPALKALPANEPLKIADLGCGGGDSLQLIARWARKNGLNVRLLGFDANPHIINFARENSRNYPEIEYHLVDVKSSEFKNYHFDVVLMTLFIHHFSDEELVKLFNQLRKQTFSAIIINDLHRHPFAYFSIKVLTKLLSRSKMVKNDAPLSVLRAFNKNELEKIIREAGYKEYELNWQWAFRFLGILYP